MACRSCAWRRDLLARANSSDMAGWVYLRQEREGCWGQNGWGLGHGLISTPRYQLPSAFYFLSSLPPTFSLAFHNRLGQCSTLSYQRSALTRTKVLHPALWNTWIPSQSSSCVAARTGPSPSTVGANAPTGRDGTGGSRCCGCCGPLAPSVPNWPGQPGMHAAAWQLQHGGQLAPAQPVGATQASAMALFLSP